ncbi:MAG: hypothetical protein Q7R47_05520 [Candidatus Diapherotrites archaeon]|nr:hypothetical protein [Candidatus Diapherotrites archaeon]
MKFILAIALIGLLLLAGCAYQAPTPGPGPDQNTPGPEPSDSQIPTPPADPSDDAPTQLPV